MKEISFYKERIDSLTEIKNYQNISKLRKVNSIPLDEKFESINQLDNRKSVLNYNTKENLKYKSVRKTRQIISPKNKNWATNSIKNQINNYSHKQDCPLNHDSIKPKQLSIDIPHLNILVDPNQVYSPNINEKKKLKAKMKKKDYTSSSNFGTEFYMSKFNSSIVNRS